MGDLWYLFITVYFILLLKSKSRQGALIMLLSFFIYEWLVLGISWEYYYALAATLNMALLMVLSRRYIYAAVCSGLLIVINFYGFAVCYSRGSLDFYNNISVVVLFIQLLLIASKGLLNGISVRGSIESFLVRVHNITGFKKNHVLSKSKEEKGFNK